MIKKIQLLTFAICLLIPIHAQANGIEAGKELYSANKATNAIVLDGDLSEWAGISVIESPKFDPNGGGDQVTFEPFGDGTWTGPEDHSANFQITWDNDNVYLGIIVTDEYHENAANSGWNGDSAQIHITSAARDSQIALYNYALGGIEGALGGQVKHEEAGPGGTDAVVSRDGTTTTYEIKFPKASLGFSDLTSGLQFGLGASINDGDEATPGQKGWSGLGPHALVFGKTTSEAALITLVPEPSTFVLSIMAIGAMLFVRRRGQR